MISPRLWLISLLCVAAGMPALVAQLPTPSGSTGGTSGGASGGSSPGTGASSAFGTVGIPAPSPSPGGAPSALPGDSPATLPAGSTPGLGTGAPAGPAGPADATMSGPVKPLDSGPTTFSISTGYGRAPEIFTSGEGRLTRPRFETKVSGSIGFDDNLFQTPTNAQGTSDVVVEQQISEGTEAQVVLIPVRNSRPQQIGIISTPPKQQVRRVVIPGTEPQFEEIVIPGTAAPKRRVSAVSRGTLNFEAQTATRRSVFTFDLNLNADYYWNRPGKKSEYNGDLAIRYLHRFTPRLQVTGSVNVSYLSQPDLSQINTPTDTGAGNYLVTSAKFDLSYRWRPRFSTVASLSYNQLSFEEEARKTGDYAGATLGMELRYLWSPKITAVIEGRYSQISYPNNPTLDSSTYFALIGLDWSLSRRATATIRVGEALRTFEDSGGKSSAPYLEMALNHQLSKASVLSWSNRFGFEEPPDQNTEVLTFRTGVSVSHSFGPRLRGSLSINGIHRSTSNDVTQTDTAEDTLDTGMSFRYTLTRRWNFSLNYSYVAVFFDPNDDNNYFRNRIFTGFDYAF